MSADPSQGERSFSPSQILPDLTLPHRRGPRAAGEVRSRNDPAPSRFQLVPSHGIWPDFDDNETTVDEPVQDTPARTSYKRIAESHASMSHSESEAEASVFDDTVDLEPQNHPKHDRYTDPTQPTSREASGDEQPGSYDLKPPPPSAPLSNIEYLADRLFSVDHLKVILRDPNIFSRFTSFLNKYRPQSTNLLQRFVDTQKAVAAVDYANAVAGQLSRGASAAALDRGFESIADSAVENLVNECLPGYVTHRLVQLVTETLVKEITGRNTPIMRELVHGLAEVYCLTDPSLPDNPIVYASEEFYNTTQYGRDYVIGRNCRFLQGPRSSSPTVQRLIDALSEGQEICETILNYRRDGSPFMNLLMIAPLYDNKGTVRYFIGAQVDINGLIEGGRGLDSFERLLAQDRAQQRYGGSAVLSKSSNNALAELSAMWGDDEIEIARKYGRERSDSDSSAAAAARGKKGPAGRRYIGMDGPEEQTLWPAPHLGSSGRLPGVFQNYLLVRPFPSLRITFTSPALRIPGLLQSKFMDRIGGPQHIRDGILSALSSGIGVTAKIQWYPPSVVDGANHSASSNNNNQQTQPSDPLKSSAPSSVHGSSRPGSKAGRGNNRLGPDAFAEGGKTRWIHCTPLLGSDERVGVWMIVMVENEAINGAINAHERAAEANAAAAPPSSYHHPGSMRQASAGVTSPRLDHQKLYEQYLRREGYSGLSDTAGTQGSGARSMKGSGSRHSGYPGAVRPSTNPSRDTSQKMKGQEEKKLKAQQLAERAMIGEDTFRDF